MMNNIQNILIVDDESKIIETVKAYLEKAGYAVLSAAVGIEAQRLLMRFPVSLVLLDLMLPDIPGEEICRRIREGFYDNVPPRTPVIMLTAKTDEGSLVRCLNMGADDYVKKPFSPRELIARINAILRRNTPAGSGAPLVISDIVIDNENHIVKQNNREIDLTFNEYAIFALLAGRPQKIFAREEIINEIMGEDFNGFDRAIDTHIKNLRQKLGDNPKNPKYIETIYGMGYRCKARQD